MKNLFPQFNIISEVEKKEIWNKAIFVFDTNVLLNIYRYKSSARKELLDVLEKLKDRIWIPHHVALEFQRNRLAVIYGQLKLFNEVRRVIKGAQSNLNSGIEHLELRKTNSLIDIGPLVNNFKKLVDDFNSEIKEIEDQQQKLNGPDLLKEKIELLFEDRVGLPPDRQELIDEIYKEADGRFKKFIPPGYIDNENKKNESTNEHSHQGLNYKRQYGDYLVWRQILDYVKNDDLKKNIVLVTSDSKEDWWSEFKLNGSKTIGARPELIDEIRTKSGAEKLLMYDTESFLHNAKSFLDADVSQDTLEEVSKVDHVLIAESAHYSFKPNEFLEGLLSTVTRWLSIKAEGIFHIENNPFDLVGSDPGGVSGFLIRNVDLLPITRENSTSTLIEARGKFEELRCKKISIIFLVANAYQSRELFTTLAIINEILMPGDLYFITGGYLPSEKNFGQMDFRVFDEFLYANTRKIIKTSN